MKRTLIAGVSLAVLAALSVLLGEALGLELTHVVLLGLAAGAVVALVDDRSLGERFVAALAGVAISWAAYGLRAGFLPDSDLGRAIDFGLVFLVATGIAVASSGRLPLWALLTGVAAFAGAYEFTFDANPPLFTSESVSALTSVLLAMMLGLVAAALTRDESAHTTSGRRAMEDAR